MEFTVNATSAEKQGHYQYFIKLSSYSNKIITNFYVRSEDYTFTKPYTYPKRNKLNIQQSYNNPRVVRKIDHHILVNYTTGNFKYIAY